MLAEYPDTKKITPDWSLNIGEFVVDIDVCNTHISVLGMHNLFCLHDHGIMWFMKRLDFRPLCIYTYMSGKERILNQIWKKSWAKRRFNCLRSQQQTAHVTRNGHFLAAHFGTHNVEMVRAVVWLCCCRTKSITQGITRSYFFFKKKNEEVIRTPAPYKMY